MKTATTFLQQDIFPAILKENYVGKKLRIVEICQRIDANKPFLISDEAISGGPFNGLAHSERMNQIRTLVQLLPKCRILLFIREPSEWIESIYYQYLHEGGVISFAEFSKIAIKWNCADFRLLIEDIRKTNITDLVVVNYDDFRNNPERTVDAICNRLAIEPFAVPIFPTRQRNTSVRRLGARLLRQANRLIRSRHNRNGIIRLGKWRAGPRKLLQGPLKALNTKGMPIVMAGEREYLRRHYAEMWDEVITTSCLAINVNAPGQ